MQRPALAERWGVEGGDTLQPAASGACLRCIGALAALGARRQRVPGWCLPAGRRWRRWAPAVEGYLDARRGRACGGASCRGWPAQPTRQQRGKRRTPIGDYGGRWAAAGLREVRAGA